MCLSVRLTSTLKIKFVPLGKYKIYLAKAWCSLLYSIGISHCRTGSILWRASGAFKYPIKLSIKSGLPNSSLNLSTHRTTSGRCARAGSRTSTTGDTVRSILSRTSVAVIKDSSSSSKIAVIPLYATGCRNSVRGAGRFQAPGNITMGFELSLILHCVMRGYSWRHARCFTTLAIMPAASPAVYTVALAVQRSCSAASSV